MMKVKEKIFCSKVQDKNEKKCIPMTLGVILSVDTAEKSSDSSLEIKEGTKSEKSYSKLPRLLDPNLGLLPYLPPLEIIYEAKMNQPWNIAPYFLDILPQSPCCNLEDCILLFGGLNPFKPDDFVLASSIFEFHQSSKTWRYYGCMMEPRCYHAVCQVGTFVYITGGYCPLQRKEGEMLAVPSTVRLDLSTTLWKKCADMKVARASHAMVAFGSNLYAFGGRDSCGNIISSVEMYDTQADSWREISQLLQPSMGLSAICVGDQIWLLGGIISLKSKNGDRNISPDVYSFKPSFKSWTVQQPLPAPLAYLSCVSSQDTMWVVGGSRLPKESSHTPLVSCAIVWHLQLNIRPHKWKILTSLSSPTHACSVTLSGRDLYVFGGMQSETMKVTNKVEIINIDTGIVRSGIRMPALLTGSSAVFLPKMASDANIRRKVKSLICRKEAVPKLHTYEKSRLPRSSGTTFASKSTDVQERQFQSQYRSDYVPPASKPKSSEDIVIVSKKENTIDYTSYQPFKKPPFLSYSAPQRIDILKSKSGQSLERVRSSEKPESITTVAHLYINADEGAETETETKDSDSYRLSVRTADSNSSIDESLREQKGKAHQTVHIKCAVTTTHHESADI